LNGVTIYMEGGGKGPDTRGALRRGMDAFLSELKDAARAKSWCWKLVCFGSREEAFRAFSNARENDSNTMIVLLVDAEGPVSGSPGEYLKRRDGWSFDKADKDIVHLMAQVMETWIVAYPEALSRHYGSRFKETALPRAPDLETVHKADIDRALEKATRETQKGHYHKIRHTSDLLARIDPELTRQRCSYCKRLFAMIGGAIAVG